jgi:hypothetical protein
LALLIVLLTLPAGALAVVRTCTTDPIANTQNVLCAVPANCTATTVTMNETIDVTNMGCEFNLNGCVGGANNARACASASACPGGTCSPRAFVVNGTFNMNGAYFMKVVGATNITIKWDREAQGARRFREPHGLALRRRYQPQRQLHRQLAMSRGKLRASVRSQQRRSDFAHGFGDDHARQRGVDRRHR